MQVNGKLVPSSLKQELPECFDKCGICLDVELGSKAGCEEDSSIS